jgi:hypothetical protein
MNKRVLDFFGGDPLKAAQDVTAVRKVDAKAEKKATFESLNKDNAIIRQSESAMAKNRDLIPGGKYIDAVENYNKTTARVLAQLAAEGKAKRDLGLENK